VSGRLALHGGGEFLPGDEPFLAALLAAAPTSASGERRVIVVPTAAARGRPDLAAAHGVEALERVAAAEGIAAAVRVARGVDAAAAADASLVAVLDDADLVHFPGGDPDLIPTLLRGSPAWAAIDRAWRRGAVLAGASAGAMALGERTWTPAGPIDGLGLVPGLAVVPHADAASWDRALARFGSLVPTGLGLLGLAERTGVLGRPGEPWRVVGAGEVRWLPPGATSPIVAADGDTLRLDATT
jgi:cyanophycinase